MINRINKYTMPPKNQSCMNINIESSALSMIQANIKYREKYIKYLECEKADGNYEERMKSMSFLYLNFNQFIANIFNQNQDCPIVICNSDIIIKFSNFANLQSFIQTSITDHAKIHRLEKISYGVNCIIIYYEEAQKMQIFMKEPLIELIPNHILNKFQIEETIFEASYRGHYTHLPEEDFFLMCNNCLGCDKLHNINEYIRLIYSCDKLHPISYCEHGAQEINTIIIHNTISSCIENFTYSLSCSLSGNSHITLYPEELLINIRSPMGYTVFCYGIYDTIAKLTKNKTVNTHKWFKIVNSIEYDIIVNNMTKNDAINKRNKFESDNE